MQLPGPIRAVVGLVAVAADEAKHLPDRAIELPMLAVSSALQMSLRAQQRYARLAARGDDVLNRRPPTDEPPAWATFDDPVPADESRRARRHDGDPTMRAASQLLEELLGSRTPDVDGHAAAKPPAKKPAAKKAAAKTSASTTKKAPAKKATSARKSTATKSAGKSINRPRHASPSRFDTVDDQ